MIQIQLIRSDIVLVGDLYPVIINIVKADRCWYGVAASMMCCNQDAVMQSMLWGLTRVTVKAVELILCDNLKGLGSQDCVVTSKLMGTDMGKSKSR